MARPFTVIGFTMFFTLALVFELGQKAAVVILRQQLPPLSFLCSSRAFGVTL